MEEELFCSGTVQYHSQPVGITVAKSQEIAEKAADLIEICYNKGKEKPVFTLRDILKRNLKQTICQDRITKAKKIGILLFYNN